MAAAKLVTRCPACRTAFRLVADQLRLRQGLVRCGQCDTVFDAREHLIEVPATPAGGGAASAPTAASQPPSPALAAALAHAEAAQAAARQQAASTPFDPGYDPGYDVPALDSPTMLMSSPEAAAATAGGTAEEAPRAPAGGTADDTAERPEQAPDAESAHEPANPPAPSPAAELTLAPADDHGAAPARPAAQEAVQPVTEAAAPAGDTPAFSAPTPTPWPTLDHGALDADNAPPAASHTQPLATPTTPASPVPSASGYLRAADTSASSDTATATTTPAASPLESTPNAIAREAATRRWVRHDDPAPAGFAPDFLRHTRERKGKARRRADHSGERAPAVPKTPRIARRTWLWTGAALLGITALAQGVYLARSQLAGHFPMLRPALEAACAPFGCTVPPWRDLDALRIDTSQLQKQEEGSDAYLLAVTLRNQGRATTALPAIELVMTDLQDQLLLRRVLQPADYLEPDQRAFATLGVRAGTELPVRVRFRTQQPVANYRVLIFYP